MKRHYADNGNDPGSDGFGGAGGGSNEANSIKRIYATFTYAMKFLAPQVLGSALIGRGGQTIKSIESQYNVKVMISNRDDTFPTTSARVCCVRGHSIESVASCLCWVVIRISELYANTVHNQEVSLGPVSEISLPTGDLALKLSVPSEACALIVGPEGTTELRQNCGVGVKVENDAFGEFQERLITLSGSTEQLQSCMLAVTRKIQESHLESWFSRWSSSTNSAGIVNPPAGTPRGGYCQQQQQPDSVMIAPSHHGPQHQHNVQHIIHSASSVAPYVMQDPRGFMMTVSIPSRMKGPVIGKGGSGVQQLYQKHGCKINIQDDLNQTDICQVHIEGNLSSVVSGYMGFMQRFVECEQTLAQMQPQIRPPGQVLHPAALHAAIHSTPPPPPPPPPML